MILDNLLVIMLMANCILLHYHRVLEKIGAKDKIITLMETSQDPGVREHALIAVQKILISDWQRIGKS
jgi:hypothetical protein